MLIGEVESVDLSEEFAHEKLSPVLAMYRAKDFDDAMAKAERLIEDGGHGHTASVYLNPNTQREKLMRFAEKMETCRIVVNTPSSQGASAICTISSWPPPSRWAAAPGAATPSAKMLA